MLSYVQNLYIVETFKYDMRIDDMYTYKGEACWKLCVIALVIMTEPVVAVLILKDFILC